MERAIRTVEDQVFYGLIALNTKAKRRVAARLEEHYRNRPYVDQARIVITEAE
jgi:hypothetical protein